MKRNLFRIEVEKHTGKKLKMVYDKRYIVNPESVARDDIKCVHTLPWGHKDIPFNVRVPK